MESLTAVPQTVANTCERLRTVADGCERKRKTWRTQPHPQTPKWNGNPRYAFGKKNLQGMFLVFVFIARKFEFSGKLQTDLQEVWQSKCIATSKEFPKSELSVASNNTDHLWRLFFWRHQRFLDQHLNSDCVLCVDSVPLLRSRRQQVRCSSEERLDGIEVACIHHFVYHRTQYLPVILSWWPEAIVSFQESNRTSVFRVADPTFLFSPRFPKSWQCFSS